MRTRAEREFTVHPLPRGSLRDRRSTFLLVSLWLIPHSGSFHSANAIVRYFYRSPVIICPFI